MTASEWRELADEYYALARENEQAGNGEAARTPNISGNGTSEMNADVVERKHAGRGAIFLLDLQRFYVVTCCESAQVEIIDATYRKCATTCPIHGKTYRKYDLALTDEARAELDRRVSESTGFNPPADPDGQRQQRRRLGGYTTERWHQARRL